MNQDVFKPKTSQFSQQSPADVFRRPWIVAGELFSGLHVSGNLDQFMRTSHSRLAKGVKVPFASLGDRRDEGLIALCQDRVTRDGQKR